MLKGSEKRKKKKEKEPKSICLITEQISSPILISQNFPSFNFPSWFSATKHNDNYKQNETYQREQELKKKKKEKQGIMIFYCSVNQFIIKSWQKKKKDYENEK